MSYPFDDVQIVRPPRPDPEREERKITASDLQHWGLLDTALSRRRIPWLKKRELFNLIQNPPQGTTFADMEIRLLAVELGNILCRMIDPQYDVFKHEFRGRAYTALFDLEWGEDVKDSEI